MSTPLIILLVVLGIAWIWDEMRSAPTIEDKEDRFSSCKKVESPKEQSNRKNEN